MRQTIAGALLRYKPMREERYVVMARHHCYERTLIPKYGERLDVPVFSCGDCCAMRGGMDVIGKGHAAKAVFQKIRDAAMRLAAMGMWN